ncbi:MAG: hypothetical protein LBJ83_03080 [Oscillospiraceae bacterium]|jgi:outer membrane protein TolC|nr:hypothetical protein [Oscillospiraceae bacterium]
MPLDFFKKGANIIAAVCFTCSFINVLNFKTNAMQEIDVNTLTEMAITIDKTLSNLNASIALQDTKRKQAQDAIPDTREKESTANSSSLFSTTEPETHGMPKEIDLLTKVAKIDAETITLQQQLGERKRELKEQVEKLFLTCYCIQEKIKYMTQDLQTEETALPEIENRVQLGELTFADMQMLQGTIANKNKQLIQLKQTWETETAKLSSLTSQSFIGCNLKSPLITCVIPRDKVSRMIDYALAHRIDTCEAETKRKLEENRTNAIFDIYKSRWPNKIATLEPAVQATGPINWDVTTRIYDNFLQAVTTSLDKDFYMHIMSVTIRIPMTQLQGDGGGTRYFDGEKYCLLEALRQREEARNQEEITTTNVRNNLIANYEELMALFQDYQQKIDAYKKTEKNYTQINLGSLLGTNTFKEMQQAKDALQLAKQTATDSLIDFNAAFISLDKETCGWGTLFKKGEDILEVESGVSAQLHYDIENTIEQRKSIFTLTILEETNIIATDYELWVQGFQVGTQQPISQSMSLFPPEITGLSEVTVKLFNSGEFVDEATFNGLDPSGNLKLKVAETNAAIKNEEEEALQTQQLLSDINGEESPQTELGNYHLQNDSSINSKIGVVLFTVSPNTETIKYFRVQIKEDTSVMASNTLSPVNEPIRLLSVMFKNPEDIEILLYSSSRKLLHTANLDEANNKLIETVKI